MRRLDATAFGCAVIGRSAATEAMGKTDQEPPEAAIPPDKKAEDGDIAFDLWLRRGLHQLYDTVANEPVPDELLRLIEEDRATRKK